MDEKNEAVRGLLKKFGYNSSSYHLLQDDKKHFFSDKVAEGVIGYIEISGVNLAAGDAVCSDGDMIQLVHEFRNFCKTNNKECCFQAITKKFKDALELMGFGFLKIGDEPFFDLNAWNTSGKEFTDLRNEINSARKRGFKVIEYCPEKLKNIKYESQMSELSKTWISEKKTGEFSFLVGSPSIDNPGDRKYFLAVNAGDDVEAFLVCVPIYARNGIYFDIMRRRQKPEKGTTELLITEANRILKEQGFFLTTLGSAPLADVTKDEKKKKLVQHALSFAYNNLNYFYRFKPLFLYKQKFGPSFWEPKYLAYYPPNFKPKYFYAILKAYDPGGISDILLSNLKSIWKKLKGLG